MEFKAGDRVAIVGSRDYPDLIEVAEFIYKLPDGVILVTGDCPDGVDYVVMRTGKLRGMTVDIKKANWGKYGKGAGPLRNQQVVAACDKLVAFQSKCNQGVCKYKPCLYKGWSHGTGNAVEIARAHLKPVELKRK